MNKEEVLKMKKDIEDNNKDEFIVNIPKEGGSEESDCSCEEVPLILTNPDLSRWSILFRYHQSKDENKRWYRKRKDFLNKVVEYFNSQSAVVIPRCNKWMSFKAIIIIQIRDFSLKPVQLNYFKESFIGI
jgi:hypothetical protein